jgi:hypothetical protein
MADYALINAPIKTWFDGAVIHLVVVDPELVDENRERPNLRLRFNAEPNSADYNPAVFNRLARYLRDQGKPAPEQDAPLTPKRPLRERPGITVAS